MANGSPLVAAVKEIHKQGTADDAAVAVIHELLEQRADPALSDDQGWTALHYAAGQCSAAVVFVLLSGRADVDALAVADHETPLHLAAQEGREAIVELLVTQGARLDAKNSDGETPLHVGVQHIGSKDLGHLKSLLRLRANPWARSNEGQDAFAMARLFTNRGEQLGKVLGDSGFVAAAATTAARGELRDLSAVVRVAAQKGQVEQLLRLLEFQPSHAVELAQQAMIPAASAGHRAVVQSLLEVRAIISGRQAEGGIAVRASPTHHESVTTTPLIAAAGESQARMVHFLLDQGAEANEPAPDGISPLMAAACSGSVEIVNMLIAARADLCATEGQGITALMAASQAGKVATVRALLDARAALDTATADGKTAKDFATSHGRTKVLELLRTRAELNARQQKKVAGAEHAEGREDGRDLEDLLAELGEGSKASNKKSSKKKASQLPTSGASKAPAERPVDEAVTQPPAAQSKKAGKKVTSPDGAAASTTAAVAAASAPVAELPSAAPAAAGTQHRQVPADTTKSETPVQLRRRLAEIDSDRGKLQAALAALDTEELQIRRRLDTVKR